MVRVDLILDPKTSARSIDKYCLTIQSQAQPGAWAGAYFAFEGETNLLPGFFVNIPLGTDVVTTNSQMVFAASFRTTAAERLPFVSDSRRKLFLAEADRIIAGIKYQ